MLDATAILAFELGFKVHVLAPPGDHGSFSTKTWVHPDGKRVVHPNDLAHEVHLQLKKTRRREFQFLIVLDR